MRYTEPQKAAFKAEFARRWRKQLVVAVPVGALLLALVFGTDRVTGKVFGLSHSLVGSIVFGVLTAAFAFNSRTWRCPACNAYIGRHPERCVHCGVVLRE